MKEREGAGLDLDGEPIMGEVPDADIGSSDGNSLHPSTNTALLCGGLEEIRKPLEQRFAGNFRVTRNSVIAVGAVSLATILAGLYMIRRRKHSESTK